MRITKEGLRRIVRSEVKRLRESTEQSSDVDSIVAKLAQLFEDLTSELPSITRYRDGDTEFGDVGPANEVLYSAKQDVIDGITPVIADVLRKIETEEYPFE